MKSLILGIILISSNVAVAQYGYNTNDHYVNGYERSNGTYVAPHEQTNPNNTRNDNYSTYGNTNPYTGSRGTKPRDSGYGNYNNE